MFPSVEVSVCKIPLNFVRCRAKHWVLCSVRSSQPFVMRNSNMSSTEKKVKKSTLALNAYAKFMDQKDELPKREFRKLVVEEMRATMGINNPGTEGMYFSWAEKQLTGRPTKVYSRGDGARARKSDRVDEATNAKLNEL